MKVYTVFVRVRCAHPNWQPILIARYIDSQWAVEASAQERKRELENSFSAFGCFHNDHGATCSIVSGSITDVALQDSAEAVGGGNDEPPSRRIAGSGPAEPPPPLLSK